MTASKRMHLIGLGVALGGFVVIRLGSLAGGWGVALQVLGLVMIGIGMAAIVRMQRIEKRERVKLRERAREMSLRKDDEDAR